MNVPGRKGKTIFLVAAVSFLLCILVLGFLYTEAAMKTDFIHKNQPPSLQYPFGTDWMGRDMFARTMAGLSMSIRIGLLTATVSAAVALLLGSLAVVMGKAADILIGGLIDLMMGIPHILLLILISFACGKGVRGVVIGILCTHWMSLARVIRGEVLQLTQSGYIQVAAKLGSSRGKIIRMHMLPHLVPQFITGLVLLFPHAILHEASITFLGFGLSSEQPAIGVILSESIRHLLTGNWWLVVFPGLSLVVTVILFDYIGSVTRRALDPASVHE
ncbi:ABC transporter permease [Kineothrix sp. MB12-C1]|uniref:ABC transporter permease n=1 Tax=Kineothrix sp. MB12-C1 TaxID=3070215 RepID=UPI0027D26FA2|nr:ABC transporter permease [Kineothrix sp. MB12-C1]WMC93128.1 ABC transporter permease [Kineothrix sp. MB12-C1]